MWLHVHMDGRNIVALHKFHFYFGRDVMCDSDVQITRHQNGDIDNSPVAVISGADFAHFGNALRGKCSFFERFDEFFVKAVRQFMCRFPEDAPAGFDNQ